MPFGARNYGAPLVLPRLGDDVPHADGPVLTRFGRPVADLRDQILGLRRIAGRVTIPAEVDRTSLGNELVEPVETAEWGLPDSDAIPGRRLVGRRKRTPQGLLIQSRCKSEELKRHGRVCEPHALAHLTAASG